MDEHVMTVAGPIAPDRLGVTLTHEHLIVDTRCWQVPPRTERQREHADSKLAIEFLGDVRRDALVYSDNLHVDEPETLLRELEGFRALGGGSIVDLSVRGLGPDFAVMRDLAERSGLNVIAGCGYYVQPSHPNEMGERSETELYEELMREIEDGLDASGVRPGVIGEIGTGQPVHADEWKVLGAACEAQKSSGLALFVHVYPDSRGRTAPEVTDFILARGVDPTRVNVCHMDGYMDVDYMVDVLRRGVIIAFDGFGLECYYDSIDGYRCHDSERERCLLELLDRGYEDRLLISQDVCMKLQLQSYGGYGFDHILRNIVPSLERHGVGPETIRRLMVETPRRLLTIAG
jgi:phosphotriesterase-related protein